MYYLITDITSGCDAECNSHNIHSIINEISRNTKQAKQLEDWITHADVGEKYVGEQITIEVKKNN